MTGFDVRTLPPLSPDDLDQEKASSSLRGAVGAGTEYTRRLHQANLAEGARQLREENPIRASLYDGINMLGRAGEGIVQGGVIDVGLGAVNLFRNQPIRFNLRDWATEKTQGQGMAAMNRALSDTTGAQFGETGEFVGDIAAGGSDLAGFILGSFGTGGTSALNKLPAAWIYGKAAQKLEKGLETVVKNQTARGILSRALGQGVVEGIRQSSAGETSGIGERLGDRAVTAAYTTLTSAAFEGVVGVVNRALARAVRDPKAQAEMDAIAKWAQESGIRKPMPEEAPQEFAQRVVHAWLASGAPGRAMSYQEYVAKAGGFLVEGGALNLLDHEFLAEEGDLIADGKWGEAAVRFAQKTMANSLGMAVLRFNVDKWKGSAPGDFLTWNRARPTSDFIPNDLRQETAYQAGQVQTADAVEAPAGAKPSQPEPYGEGLGRPQEGPAPEPMRSDAPTQASQGRVDDAAAYEGWAGGDNAPTTGDLWRLGLEEVKADEPTLVDLVEGDKPQGSRPTVEDPMAGMRGDAPEPKPAEKPSYREFSLGDTPLTFKVNPDGTVEYSDRLAKALGLGQTKLKANEFFQFVEQVSVLDALVSKWMLPGEEWAPGIYAQRSVDPSKPSKLRQVRAGRIWEKDASSKDKWVEVGEAKPAREPEPVDPSQIQAADALLAMRSQFGKQSKPVADVLDALDYSLRSVSGERDPGIKDLTDAINSGLVQSMVAEAASLGLVAGNSSPRLRAAILQVAKIATHKDPLHAVEDLQDELNVADTQEQDARIEDSQRLAQAKGEAEFDVTEQEAAVLGEVLSPETVAAQTQPGKVKLSAEEAGKVSQQARKTTREKAQALDPVIRKMVKAFGVQDAPIKPAREVRASEELRAAEQASIDKLAMDRAIDEGGPTLLYGGDPTGIAIAKLAEIALPAVKQLVTDPMLPSLIDRTREAGAVEVAKQGRRVVSEAKKTYGKVAETVNTLLRSVRGNRKALRELHRFIQLTDGSKVEVGHALMDDLIREKVIAAGRGSELQVSGDAQAIVDQWNEVRYRSMEMYEKVGATMETAPGVFEPIKADKETRRLPRSYTEAGLDIVLNRSGRAYDAFVREVAKLNGIDLAEAGRRVAELMPRALTKRGAFEHSRVVKVLPDHISVDGRWVQILETRPAFHAQRLARMSADRSAFISEFGQGRQATDAEVQEVAAQFPGQLPLTAHGVVMDTLKKHGTQAAKRSIDMIRALNNLPTHPPVVDVNSPLDRIGRAGMVAMSVWRSLRLQMQAAANVTELIGGGAMAALGGKRMLGAIGKSLRALTNGATREQFLNQLQSEGLITRDVLATDIGTGDMLARYESAAKLFGDVSGRITGAHFTQEFVEMALAVGAKDLVADLKSGKASSSDRAFLRQLGFDRAEVELMASGKAAPELYDDAATMIPGWLTGGTTRRGAEKTMFEHGRVFKNLIAFQGYATRRWNQIRTAANIIRESGGKEGKLHAAKLAAMIGVQTTALLTLGTLLRNGTAGVYDLYLKAMEDPDEFAQDFLASANANWIVGSTLIEATDDDRQTMADFVARQVAPLSVIRDLNEFVDSFGLAAGAKTDNRYAGLTTTEKFSQFLINQSPLIKAVANNTPLLGSVAITEDAELTQALRSYYSWKSENDPGSSTVTDLTPFLDSMKRVALLVKEGRLPGDPEIAQALMAAAQAEGWDRVAENLRGKRTVARYAEKPELLNSLINRVGPDAFSQLRAYDNLLDAMADWAK